MALTRREMLVAGGAAAMCAKAPAQSFEASFAPTWESLASRYRVPDWFRDAKFGIWAHWGPQCQPEWGDWYARLIYVQGRQAWQQGETPYEHHLKHYGHPSRTGFIDIIGQWKAEHWEPEQLLSRYVKAGARYFMAMGCHHDNLDLFASRHHAWNSVRVGPKRDILGTWEPLVRAAGLKFGVSNHSSHAWHWYQTAYGYDSEGPMRGRRYDAYWLRRKHGEGKFWDGLDPQDLYTGPYYVPPEGITSTEAMNAWHDQRDGQWLEAAPPFNPEFVRSWLAPTESDRRRLPARPHLFRRYRASARASRARCGGLFLQPRCGARRRGRSLRQEARRHAAPRDRRGRRARLGRRDPRAAVADRHLHRQLALRPADLRENGYKSAKQVVQRLADIVSKNGNLLLNIPVRGDGTIDEKEEAIVDQIAAWTKGTARRSSGLGRGAALRGRSDEAAGRDAQRG